MRRELIVKVNFLFCLKIILDLRMYHYETKNVNKAMKRNIDRFPEDFCFQLTKEEVENLKFQNGTSSLEKQNYGGEENYLMYNELQKGKETEFKQQIFFNGQIYDAYSLIIDIIKIAKNKILIIDNYIDESILKMQQKKNKNVEVVILTSQNCNLTKLDINKFNKSKIEDMEYVDKISSLKGCS